MLHRHAIRLRLDEIAVAKPDGVEPSFAAQSSPVMVHKLRHPVIGSCAELALRHGLSAGAVSSRRKREKWRMAVPQLDQKLDQRLDQLTTAKAETLAERAARFRDRTLTESENWLDHIQRAKALVAENDTQGLKELISAWQIPVQVGAKLLHIDETPVERPRILIGVVADLRSAVAAGRESPRVIELAPTAEST